MSQQLHVYGDGKRVVLGRGGQNIFFTHLNKREATDLIRLLQEASNAGSAQGGTDG